MGAQACEVSFQDMVNSMGFLELHLLFSNTLFPHRPIAVLSPLMEVKRN